MTLFFKSVFFAISLILLIGFIYVNFFVSSGNESAKRVKVGDSISFDTIRRLYSDSVYKRNDSISILAFVTMKCPHCLRLMEVINKEGNTEISFVFKKEESSFKAKYMNLKGFVCTDEAFTDRILSVPTIYIIDNKYSKIIKIITGIPNSEVEIKALFLKITSNLNLENLETCS